jgi:hypothetical protein
LVCPQEGYGRDSVTLSEEIARASMKQIGPIEKDVAGAVDTGGREYATTPPDIMGNLLIGWWSPYAMRVHDTTAIQVVTPEQATEEGVSEEDQIPVDGGDVIIISGPDYNRLSTAEQEGFSALTSLDLGNSGVSYWNNMVPRYRNTVDDTSRLHVANFLDLQSYGLFAPYLNDGDIRFRAAVTNTVGPLTYGGNRFMYTTNGEQILPVGSNPCVWIVYKNMATVDESPFSRLIYLNTRYDTEYSTSLSQLAINRSASSGQWYTEARYEGAETDTVDFPTELTVQDKRMVWSARMEETDIVMKIANREYTTALSTSTEKGTEKIVNNLSLGWMTDGEISEIVLTSGVPTATQISNLEAYFKKVHPDIVETL